MSASASPRAGNTAGPGSPKRLPPGRSRRGPRPGSREAGAYPSRSRQRPDDLHDEHRLAVVLLPALECPGHFGLQNVENGFVRTKHLSTEAVGENPQPAMRIETVDEVLDGRNVV